MKWIRAKRMIEISMNNKPLLRCPVCNEAVSRVIRVSYKGHGIECCPGCRKEAERQLLDDYETYQQEIRDIDSLQTFETCMNV